VGVVQGGPTGVGDRLGGSLQTRVTSPPSCMVTVVFSGGSMLAVDERAIFKRLATLQFIERSTSSGKRRCLDDQCTVSYVCVAIKVQAM
jgi:hypothetical protein